MNESKPELSNTRPFIKMLSSLFLTIGLLFSCFALHSQTVFSQTIPPTSKKEESKPKEIAPRSPAAPNNAFSYQGKLTFNGNPANGLYDFNFSFYTALTGGSLIGSVVAKPNLQVTNGIFTTQILNNGLFADTEPKWIQIDVRLAGTADPYVTLSPRQELTSSPFAVLSQNAKFAEVADYALTADSAVTALASQTAVTATNATNATNAINSQNAINATNAVNATNAQNAVTAGNSTNLGGIAASEYSRFKWNVITANTQAEPNKGYLVNSPNELNITLPASPQVGDTVKVACADAAGFTITKNAGQSIILDYLTRNYWFPVGPVARWTAVATSADGSNLFATSIGRIYVSQDFGLSWTPRAPNLTWTTIASSSNGVKLVAAAYTSSVFTSDDSGLTWIQRTGATTWTSVASSADGVKLVAVGSFGSVITSPDSGLSWVDRTFTSNSLTSVTSSVDGTKLVSVSNNGVIYRSTDSGISWTTQTLSGNWVSVASSADGTNLVAVQQSGRIYTSADSGTSWTARESIRNWSSVASSANGTKLVATERGGQIYISSDSGVTWIPRDITPDLNKEWLSVASSEDGSKLITASGGSTEKLYLKSNPSNASVLGIRGTGADSVELVYVGNGKFVMVNSKGFVVEF